MQVELVVAKILEETSMGPICVADTQPGAVKRPILTAGWVVVAAPSAGRRSAEMVKYWIVNIIFLLLKVRGLRW